MTDRSRYLPTSMSDPPRGFTAGEWDAHIEATVARTREEQGLPAKVSDPLIYESIANIVAESREKRAKGVPAPA